MTPVDQTKFGFPEGNCLAACIASIIGVAIEEAPDCGDSDWLGDLIQWLAPRGLYPICFRLDDKWRPDGYYILGGKSPRGDFLHAVVARGRSIVHDPHPSRDGVLSWDDATIFVQIDPDGTT